MINFTLHTPETAPEGSKEFLNELHGKFGAYMNNWLVMAESPAVFKSYMYLIDQLSSNGTLSMAEQTLVQMTASRENGCRYCIPVYTLFGPQQGLDQAVVNAVLAGEPIPDKRLATLHDFTLSLMRNHGRVSEEEVQAFFDAGFTNAQLLDVLGGIAAKTLINTLTQLTDIPLDNMLLPFAWEPAVAA